MEEKNALIQLFSNGQMTPKELELVLSGYEKVYYQKGDYILEEGQTAKEYYVIESGFVRSFAIDYEGNDITTDFHNTGELLIQVVSFFLQKPSEEYLQALTDVVLWRTGIEVFYQHFNTIENYSDWGRTWMVNNLFQNKQRSLSLVKDAAKDRYLHLLEHRPEIFAYATLQQIASYLGITNTSLSRIRREVAQ
ncbi:MAG: Crp/Fnr family transcriptional regulator [Bacteroidota bacterium]